MTDRSYSVRLEANVVGFIAQVGVQAVNAVTKLENAAQKAGRKIDDLGSRAAGIGPKIDAGIGRSVKGLDDLAKRIDNNRQNLDTLGRGATRMGLVAAAGIGLAAKAAIDWETAWTGVEKTVDGTTTQLATLEGQLRSMAKTLPESHAQIAAVAEAAGQLGVRREDIASFTKVMVDLGETTNLTSDEAATSLAQFMNVMGTAPKDVGRLGASIVALGNNGASTERDIVQMAQRISGSGKIIGLTETQVLGFASALSNVGIEAEAGGSAISTIFTKIDMAVSEGGEHLQNFATVSGETSAQFKQHFETDAAGATLAFLQGIGAINDAGQDVNGTLEALGITEIRQRDAVLRLAASGSNLADSLKTSADGWRENTALVDEAAKRYATTESQIQIAWNNIKDSAITAGAEMLPVIADIAGKVASAASAFGDLPGPVKTGGLALLGIVAAGGLVGGSLLKLVTSAAQARTAMIELGSTSGRTAKALGAFTKAGIVGASVVGLLALTDALDQAFGNVPKGNLTQLSSDLLTLGSTARASGALAERFGESLDGVSRKGPDLKGLGETMRAALGADIPQLDGNAKSVKALDEALASLVQSGNVDGAKAAFEVISAEAAKVGLSLEDTQSLLPKYVSNLATAQAAAQASGQVSGGAASGTKSLGQALDGTAESAEDAATKLKDYIDALFQMPNLILGVRDAQRGVQEAIDGANASIEENGRTLNIAKEKGRANQAALDAIATSANKLSEAYLNSGASQKTMTDGAVAARRSFVDTAVKMGLTKAAAQALAEEVIKIPDKKATEVSNNAGPDQAPAKAFKGYREMLTGTPTSINTTVTNNAGQAPKTNAQIYREMLTGTPKTVQTFVQNNAPVAQSKIDQYRTVLGLTPKSKSTNVSAPGAVRAAGDVGSLLGLLNNLPSSRTVTIRTRSIEERIVRTQTTAVTGGHATTNADGGYYPHGMFPSYADGKLPDQAMIAPGRGRGLVQWAEAETLGEAFIPLAPGKRGRSTEILAQVADSFGLQLVRSFSSGGFLPGGKLVDIAFLLQQMGIPFNPTAGINYAGALSALTKANTAAAPSRTAAIRADAAEQAAKLQVARIQRSITLQQRYIKQLRDQGASESKIKSEQRELIGLQDQLYRAKNKVTAATKASNAADAVYKTKADAAKAATDAYKDAVEKLVAQQKEAVQLASQVASGLTNDANIGDLFSKSLTGKGLLADLQQKGADLAAFRSLTDQLRARGLTEELVEQIIGKGAGQGTAVAQAILNGGLAMFNALNRAQWELEKQANLIGAGVATAQYGMPVAGARAGGGPVWAGQTYRVNEKGQEFFTAPIDGYVIPNAVDPRRYIRSIAGTGTSSGGAAVTKEVHVHQTLQFYGVSMAEADLIAQRANAKADLMNRGY